MFRPVQIVMSFFFYKDRIRGGAEKTETACDVKGYLMAYLALSVPCIPWLPYGEHH